MKVQYITNEQGKQVGVVLDLDDYRQLIASKVTDPEMLKGMSSDELTALANSKLAPETQEHLDELLEKQKQNKLSEEEELSLDRLLSQIDQLNILKTRANYTLKIQ